ncbi:MAG: type II toxin-antitoxin system RelE/ParE family toxin [Flavobacteriales bacterium]|nr:type II toxin-antitoxin system RelE/ParE family toxin [Flavobacteriales bacterium]
MALKIIILKRTSIKLDKNIQYLVSEWGESVAIKFVRKFDDLIGTLSSSPEIGKIEKNNLRSFVLIKQVTIFYRVTSKQIIIVNLFFNRQNPKKK